MAAAATAKVAIVTGAARRAGIGHACAVELHRSGYRVVGLDVLAPEPGTLWLEAASGGSGAAGAAAAAAPALLRVDLADEDAIAALPQRLRAEAGVSRCDCLVNNAGIADPYLRPQTPGDPARRAAFKRFLAVNLVAPFLLTEALAPLMPERSASVVHIASTRALQSEPHCEGYAASKAGLVGLTHAQAASLAGRARVNCVCPGWVDTAGDGGAALRPRDHEWHWTGSVGRPEDVAAMVAFLADDARSGFITGQQFVVDGGVTKRMTYPDE